MVFTAIVYKSDARKQKTAVTIVTDSFEDAQKKLLSLYGKIWLALFSRLKKISIKKFTRATKKKLSSVKFQFNWKK